MPSTARRRFARLFGALVVFIAVIGVSRASRVEAVGSAGWRVVGTEVVRPDGQPFPIAGVSWYGFETRLGVAHGLWQKDYKFLVDRIKATGSNTIRIPFSNYMWETNPRPATNDVAGCPACSGLRARDILARIVNYAGSVGLHVILDNHRSTGGDSAQENGLWYASGYPEQAWIRDWVNVQQWVHAVGSTLGSLDTVAVNLLASDGFPIVIGYDLRNEPHTPAGTSYTAGATWGTGDGINPSKNPNPNPFRPACITSSTCKDWRLAAERAADTLLGDALARGWDYPLIFVEGVSHYPQSFGTPAKGPYDTYWWGGNLRGINGNARNPGAPIVLNAGGSARSLGPPVYGQLVYSAHDYGPTLYAQHWFNSTTCYFSGCSGSSLADVWHKFWSHVTVSGGINPVWPGRAAYPWGNTGHVAYSQAPVWMGEFGTGNTAADLVSSTRGSQGQWFTAMVNFIQSSWSLTPANNAGVPATRLHWTYWALNANDSYGILGGNWIDLAVPDKVYTFLCAIQPTRRASCSAPLPHPGP